jgi:hypothetical protein
MKISNELNRKTDNMNYSVWHIWNSSNFVKFILNVIYQQWFKYAVFRTDQSVGNIGN